MKILSLFSSSSPSKIGLIFLVFSAMAGCKKAPQHIHNGPEYHRVTQHLTVPIDVRQSHDADDSQNISLTPPAPGPKLNLNFPGKNSSSQTVTNTNNTTRMSNRVNNVQNGGNPPAYHE